VFDEVNGLPLHPLAVHASVVLIPLAALLGILFVIPRTRAWASWPLLLVSLGCVASVFVSRQSGQALANHANLQGKAAELLDEHKSRANQLWIFIIIFAVIAVAAFLLSRAERRTPRDDGADRDGRLSTHERSTSSASESNNSSGRSGLAILNVVVSVLLVVGAIGVAYQTYRVGDIGSRMLWNPDGSQDFSSSD
jgi:hypothetical protein